MKSATVLSILCALLLASRVAAQCEPQHILPPPADTGGKFGYDMQLNDHHLIVADYQGDTPCAGGTCSTGAVHAYRRETPDGPWVLRQTVYPVDVQPGDGFGKVVHLDGDRMIVGATSADLGGVGTGGAYIFEFTGDTWEETARFASPAPHFMSQFGRGVFLDGGDGIALVTQYTGQVFVFTESVGAWRLAEVLSPPDAPDGGDAFGDAIAMNDEWLFLGAHYDGVRGSSSGAVYAYRREGVADFEFDQKIYPPDPEAKPTFGSSVIVHNDALLVAGPEAEGVFTGQGAVYEFALIDGLWTLRQRLTHVPMARNEFFGVGIAVHGQTLLVGAHGRREPGIGGAAFMYRRGSNGAWSPAGQLRPAGGGGYYGVSVAVHRSDAVVGAPYSQSGGLITGAAFAFDLECHLCRPDLDADGTLTIFDFLTFFNLFDAGDARADFDGDGELTIFDFLAFQTAFDAGCE